MVTDSMETKVQDVVKGTIREVRSALAKHRSTQLVTQSPTSPNVVDRLHILTEELTDRKYIMEALTAALLTVSSEVATSLKTQKIDKIKMVNPSRDIQPENPTHALKLALYSAFISAYTSLHNNAMFIAYSQMPKDEKLKVGSRVRFIGDPLNLGKDSRRITKITPQIIKGVKNKEIAVKFPGIYPDKYPREYVATEQAVIKATEQARDLFLSHNLALTAALIKAISED